MNRLSTVTCVLLLTLLWLGCESHDSKAKSSAIPVATTYEEYATQHYEIAVDPTRDIQQSIHYSLKLLGKNVKYGNCTSYPEELSFLGGIEIRPSHKLLYATSDQPDLKIDAVTHENGSVDVCTGIPGVKLKSGTYTWHVGLNSKNYIYEAKDHDLLLLVMGLSKNARIPISKVTGEITFQRLTLPGGLTKAMPLTLVQGRAMKGRIDDIWAGVEEGHESPDVMSFRRAPEKGDVVQFTITQPILPGDLVFAVISWPARVYTDREALPVESTPSPTPSGPQF